MTLPPARSSLLATIEEAIAPVRDGAVVGIGGAVTAAHPMALVRALARRRVTELTVVAPTAGLDVDLLIAAGCVRKVISSYVGAEGIAPVGPAFRAAAVESRIEVADVDEAHCVLGLRAAAQGLPFLPWRGGVGTALPELNPALVEFDDPVAGQRLIAVPAIELDYALIHAERSDQFGNVQFVGTGHLDPVIAAAAQRVIVQAGRVISNEEIRRDPGATHYWRDTAVTRAPWGCHPYSDATIEADEEHLRSYALAAQDAANGDGASLASYLKSFVYEPASHTDYLERIGLARITDLAL